MASRLGSNGARARLAHRIAQQIGPAERRYVRDLRAVMRGMARAYEKAVAPHLASVARKTDTVDTLPNVINVMSIRVQVAIPHTVGPLFDRMSGAVSRQNAKGQTLMGITPRGANLEDVISSARDANISLVKNVAEEYAGQLRDLLADPDNFGLRVEDLAAKIAERGDVAGSRAELIARDQTLKLNGKITETRQRSAGVGSYVWSTSLDDRVREEHAELEGQTFSWDNPPEPGHPGEDIQCRCVAVPVVEELDDALGSGDDDASDEVQDTIKKTPEGYEVVSERTGKRLTRRNLTKAQAEKRLRQIEYFKHRPQRHG